MKKRYLSLILVLTIGLLAAAFGGCNLVKSGKMKDIKGTYELTRYARTYESAHLPASGEAVADYKANENITMYLVFDGSGEGQIVYKSDSLGTVRYKVAMSYTYDTEETDHVTYVKYQSGYMSNSDSTERSILHDENLAVFASSEPTLSYDLPNYRIFDIKKGIEKVYTDSISFKRVSKKTDMSYVEDKLGALPALYNMALSRFDGIMSINSMENYAYYYMDIDVAAMKADLYYAQAPDKVKGTDVITEADIVDMDERGVPITCDQSGVTINSVTIGGRVFNINNFSGLTDAETNEAFGLRYGDMTLEDSIENSRNVYLNWFNGTNA